METVTMKNFDSDTAWDLRFDVPVTVGTKLLVDKANEYKVVGIDMPEDMEHNCPWYTLEPIGKTLEQYKRDYDDAAKKNLSMVAYQYPNFQFKVESQWFFSRNVSWE